MCEERVEVRLRAQVEDLRVVSVVDVCKNAKQLAIDVLDRCWEGRWEVMA